MALFPRVQHRMALCHSSFLPVGCLRVPYHSSLHPVYPKVRCRTALHCSRLPAGSLLWTGWTTKPRCCWTAQKYLWNFAYNRQS